MEIITRDFISKEAVFHAGDTEFTRSRLLNEINFWKNLLTNHNVKQGDKIGLALYVCDSSYMALTFATFELSLKLVILLKPTSEKDAKRQAFNPYYPVDVLILTRHMEEFYTNFYSKNSLKTLFLEDELEKFDEEEIYDGIILSKPDDVLMLCTSSGTTGNAKLISHTHRFFYDLCTKNWKSLNFQKEDRILHLITFNHGSVLGVYFLPSLYYSNHHYFFIEGFAPADPNPENWERFISFCQRHKITKVQCTYKFLVQYMFDAIARSEVGLPDLTIMIISFIDPRWEKLVKEGKVKKIVSIFGCSETSGPLFLPYLDQTTKNFNPNFLGKPIDDYHNIEIIDNRLNVYIPTYNQFVDTEDKISKDEDNNCTFIGKNKSYRINDIVINFSDLQELIEKNINNVHQMDLIIIVDEVYSNLYIVTDKRHVLDYVDDIKKLIKDFYKNEIELKDIIYINYMFSYLINTKPDREKLLDYVRNLK